MYGYIYLTINNINGKKYIGQHRADHFDTKYYGSGILLVKALQRYGKDNFSIKFLEPCFSDEELNLREICYIKEFDAVNSDEYYNIAHGGLGHTCTPWNKGVHTGCTPAQYETLSKGWHLPASEKLKKKLSEYRTGIVVSEETRKKLSDAQKGKVAVNNGEITKYIHNTELNEYLTAGWVTGMIKRKKYSQT